MSVESERGMIEALNRLQESMTEQMDENSVQIQALWRALGRSDGSSSGESNALPTESPRELEQRRREAAWLQLNGGQKTDSSITPLCIHCAYGVVIAYKGEANRDEWFIHCQALHTETAVDEAPTGVCTKQDAVEPIDPRTPTPTRRPSGGQAQSPRQGQGQSRGPVPG